MRVSCRNILSGIILIIVSSENNKPGIWNQQRCYIMTNPLSLSFYFVFYFWIFY